MDPLAVVEEKLGSFDSWPSSVLTDMFYEEPKFSVSRRVAAYLYGNGMIARGTLRSCTRRLRQRGGTSQRHICMGGICSGIRVFLLRYSTTI